MQTDIGGFSNKNRKVFGIFTRNVTLLNKAAVHVIRVLSIEIPYFCVKKLSSIALFSAEPSQFPFSFNL